jgi:hypothetical protein
MEGVEEDVVPFPELSTEKLNALSTVYTLYQYCVPEDNPTLSVKDVPVPIYRIVPVKDPVPLVVVFPTA